MLQEGDYVGNVYQVPDKWWGFEAFGRRDHPGACVARDRRGYKVVMLKGTDPKSADYRYAEVLVEPDNSNGLKKVTSFSIKPWEFSARKVSLLTDVMIGILDRRDLQRMQAELQRQFGNADEE